MGHNGPIGSDSFQKSLCESNFLFLSELHQSDLIKLRKQSLPRYNENHSLFVTIVQLFTSPNLPIMTNMIDPVVTLTLSLSLAHDSLFLI